MMDTILTGVVVSLLLGFFYAKNKLLTRQIIFEYEGGLQFKNGKFFQILKLGKHWIWSPTTSVRTVDVRRRVLSIPGQEILTADNITIKINLAVQYEVTDVKKAILKQENYTDALYLTLQLALREIITLTTADNLLASRNDIGKKVSDICGPKLEQMGLKLHVSDIKDIMFPGDLKKVFSKVVEAQKEGLAILEKARGETAALRQLANAAKLLEENPYLMQLRMLQSTGHTFVITPIKSQNQL